MLTFRKMVGRRCLTAADKNCSCSPKQARKWANGAQHAYCPRRKKVFRGWPFFRGDWLKRGGSLKEPSLKIGHFRNGFVKKTASKDPFLGGVSLNATALENGQLSEVVFLIEPPLKMDLQRRSWSYSALGVVRGGMLGEPPLIEKRCVAENDFCSSVETMR
jgi:hypothetical protein